MSEKALELASRITHPWTIAVFVSVITAVLLVPALRGRRAGIPRAVWIILSAGIVALGLFPAAATTFLQSRGIYRVRVITLDPNGLPTANASVTSSVGGETKKVEGGWEFSIPPQVKPSDGKVVFFASVRSAFLTGSSTLTLADDYYPTATIQLAADTSAVVRGVVLDANGRSVEGADVSIPGYADRVTTDKMGNFSLPAHAADGQIVQVRAQKSHLIGSVSVPAGNTPAQIVIRSR